MTPEQKQERDAVVAWAKCAAFYLIERGDDLTNPRRTQDYDEAAVILSLADAIERGDHREGNNGK